MNAAPNIADLDLREEIFERRRVDQTTLRVAGCRRHPFERPEQDVVDRASRRRSRRRTATTKASSALISRERSSIRCSISGALVASISFSSVFARHAAVLRPASARDWPRLQARSAVLGSRQFDRRAGVDRCRGIGAAAASTPATASRPAAAARSGASSPASRGMVVAAAGLSPSRSRSSRRAVSTGSKPDVERRRPASSGRPSRPRASPPGTGPGTRTPCGGPWSSTARACAARPAVPSARSRRARRRR